MRNTKNKKQVKETKTDQRMNAEPHRRYPNRTGGCRTVKLFKYTIG